MGKEEDMIDVINDCDIDTVALATVLHKNKFSVKELKKILKSKNFYVRNL